MTGLKVIMLSMLGYDQPHPMIITAQKARRRFEEARRDAEAMTQEPERTAFRIAAGEPQRERENRDDVG